jgi:hypothetical protein
LLWEKELLQLSYAPIIIRHLCHYTSVAEKQFAKQDEQLVVTTTIACNNVRCERRGATKGETIE